MLLSKGSVLDGKYEIISLLGAGGFAVVYKARHLQLDKVVAVKILKGEFQSRTPDADARLQREGLALSALSHPSIVGVLGFGFCQDAPYIVMEFVHGKNLQETLQGEGPMDAARAIMVIGEVCRALGVAHEGGVTHRDLKPSNIMICSSDGHETVKVIDFGLARLMPEFGKELQKLTKTDNVVGSVLFMSPEQCFGRVADPRSDIYSIGAVLQFCLTGSPLFPEESVTEVMAAQCYLVAPRLADQEVRAPAGLQNVINKCIAKSPDLRYQNTNALLKDLKLVADGHGDEIPEVSVRTTTGGNSRTKLISPFAIAALCLLSAGCIWFLSNLNERVRDSSRELYTRAAKINESQSAGFERQVIPLVRQLMLANAIDKRLTDMEVLEAQLWLSDALDRVGDFASQQEVTVSMLKDPVFSRLPVNSRMKCYGRASRAFTDQKDCNLVEIDGFWEDAHIVSVVDHRALVRFADDGVTLERWIADPVFHHTQTGSEYDNNRNLLINSVKGELSAAESVKKLTDTQLELFNCLIGMFPENGDNLEWLGRQLDQYFSRSPSAAEGFVGIADSYVFWWPGQDHARARAAAWCQRAERAMRDSRSYNDAARIHLARTYLKACRWNDAYRLGMSNSEDSWGVPHAYSRALEGQMIAAFACIWLQRFDESKRLVDELYKAQIGDDLFKDDIAVYSQVLIDAGRKLDAVDVRKRFHIGNA